MHHKEREDGGDCHMIKESKVSQKTASEQSPPPSLSRQVAFSKLLMSALSPIEAP
jgi:hypothetical protein